MDVHGKIKDNTKSIMDVVEVCNRPELHLHPGPSGKPVTSKVKFVLSMDKRRELCEWVKEFQMPNGYYSNLRNIMGPNEAKFNNMKSYDIHVFMETVLPIAFGALPDDVLKPVIKISQFFKNLC